MEKLGISLGAN
jgi:dynein heavy chain